MNSTDIAQAHAHAAGNYTHHAKSNGICPRCEDYLVGNRLQAASLGRHYASTGRCKPFRDTSNVLEGEHDECARRALAGTGF